MSNVKKKMLLVSIMVAVFITSLVPITTYAAADGTPLVDSWTITSYSDPNALTTAAKELSQKVTATVYFDEAVNVNTVNLASNFIVSIYGAQVGTGIMSAMSLAINTVGSNAIEFVISSNSSNSPPTAPFFGIRGGNLTITSANGSTIPNITAAASPNNVLPWNSSTFADQLIDTGIGLSTTSVTTATSTTGSVLTIAVTSAPVIRAANFFQITITNSGVTTVETAATTPTSTMLPTIPAVANDCFAVHSHSFYSMTASSTATDLASAINDPSSGLNGLYTASATGNVLTITQVGSFNAGDTINLVAHNYTNQ